MEELQANLIEQFARGVRDTHAKDHVVHEADSFKTLDEAVKDAKTVMNRKERRWLHSRLTAGKNGNGQGIRWQAAEGKSFRVILRRRRFSWQFAQVRTQLPLRRPTPWLISVHLRSVECVVQWAACRKSPRKLNRVQGRKQPKQKKSYTVRIKKQKLVPRTVHTVKTHQRHVNPMTVIMHIEDVEAII